MAGMLDKEIETYHEHRDSLLADAEGKFVLVKGAEIINTFESKRDAVEQGYDRFGNAPFLVKRVLKIEIPLNYVTNFLSV